MNFRDLGGVPVTGGVVVSGKVFRTAHLSEIDERSAEHIAKKLGIARYLDFRHDEEITRDGHPTVLLTRGVRWVRHPFEIGDDVFSDIRRPGAPEWEALYSRAFRRLVPTFAAAIHLIAEEDTPIVFGCWVGKDRTGIVASLFLSLLGADDAVITADYARTTAALASYRDRFAFLTNLEPDVAEALFASHATAHPEAMLGFLRAIRAEFGSVQEAMAVPDALVETLRSRYVTLR
jgi:protein-tyrosine phosphatase